MMKNDEIPMREQIEDIFQDIGGFTWEQAETWVGFCSAVGMEPLPFLKVMLNNICEVKLTSDGKKVPSRADRPELWGILKGRRTHFKLIGPV